MKLELTSGAWIEIRGADQLTAGDKLAMHAATILPVEGEELDNLAEGRGSFSFTLSTMDEQLYGVLASIIQGWSYPYVIPKNDDSRDEKGRPTYADSLRRLPLDDWNELEQATSAHMDKLRASPKGARTTSTSSASSSLDGAVNSQLV